MNRPARAFSLVELLVCIGVIAILLGALLPALGGARRQADGVRLLANQRDALMLVSAYTVDHDGRFPGFGIEGTMVAPLEFRAETLEFTWWNQIEYWGLYLHTRGYDGWVSLGPGADRHAYDRIDCAGCGHGRSEHVFAAGAFAEPERFVDGAPSDSSLHRVMSASDVAYPAAKGLLVHLRSIGLDRVLVGFADGGARAVPALTLKPGAEADMPYAGLPVVATADGLRGRDI